MITLSPRMSKIRPSPTLAISDEAKRMQSLGLDVISLGAGEPDFDTPDYVNEAAIVAIRSGKTKYTAVSGTLQLKSAIIEDIAYKYNVFDYTRLDVCVTSGAKQAIFNLIMAIIDKGDEVIIPSPYWVSYIDIVKFAGGTPVVVQCNEESNFKLTASALEKHITDKTKLLIINSPNNPTGLIYSKEELKEISEVLLKHENVFLMTDDIYEHILFDDVKFCSMVQIEPKLIERIFIINGVSKGYAMTGWRIGYIASKNSTVIKAVDIIQSQSTSNACSISQEAATAALIGNKSFMLERSTAFQQRRDFVLSKISSIPGLLSIKPDGAFYICFKCSSIFGKNTPAGTLLSDDMSYASALLTEALVAVVPGSAFGMDGYIRLSYATSDKNLEQAMQRISDFHNNLTA